MKLAKGWRDAISRNPFLVREGFLIGGKYERVSGEKTECRNPFLVREGFLMQDGKGPLLSTN